MALSLVNVRSLLCRSANTGTKGFMSSPIRLRRSIRLSNCLSTSPYCYNHSRLSSRERTEAFAWLGDLVPVFGTTGNKVSVLHDPTVFFNVLKGRIWTAEKRIVLSSLYLGNGPLEQELVAALHTQLERVRDLQVTVLLDYTRGSRGTNNSRTLLLPLLQNFPDRVQVSLYHTPDLRGLLKAVVPERFNETIGLQHMKIYLTDNSVIMSGANLSEIYFTNRQDRYIVLHNIPLLADMLANLVSCVASFSFQLCRDNSVTLHPSFNIHPYKDDIDKFKSEARRRVMDLLKPGYFTKLSDPFFTDAPFRHRKKVIGWKRELRERSIQIYDGDDYTSHYEVEGRDEESDEEMQLLIQQGAWVMVDTRTKEKTVVHPDSSNVTQLKRTIYVDTWICPLVQMGPLGVWHDEMVTRRLLRTAPKESELLLASGYFNLTEDYMNVMLQADADFNILMASPQVNGFYGAKGIAGSIPTGYTYIAREFHRRVWQQAQQDRIRLQEYIRNNWTFHGKGLWFYHPGEDLPSLTLVGSPNFGYRSVHRDLEAQLAIVTDNWALRQQLHQEQRHLYQGTEEVTKETFQRPDRQVPSWAKALTRVIKNFF
ncbi:CDP-diacylglycerol--glycerol-3-phosphate 3-phosphatidyltransferase, mitochondrial-like [Branchiostoma floridae]|uniref:CDP-diacylglycerol--glycerol-3-phosphate 3-phosphatidyltransferase n=1 Tax=Branchiostoma floridae TaxID=7739 RepID=A0A9J7M6M2_BRAFL|nr:CDP-diacylglycerol--glycerol-3-phosphate 3-phosphatidyltransferase, mitochondrial-like [Branchiostoma floridae]